MIRRTYERVAMSSLDAVVVATDDQRIFDEVLGFGGRAVMTRTDHRTGTDRCREALDLMGEDFDAVVNIQGDEPFIDPGQIDRVAELIREPEVQLATLVRKIDNPARIIDPNTVKVVMDNDLNALYFSRHPIPFVRGVEPSQWLQKTDYYQHIGIYAYKANVLRMISALPSGRLEQAESLEQLRWLEHGLRIRLAVVSAGDSISIDTPDDLLNIPQELLR